MTRPNGCDHCPGSHTGERPCLGSATVKARSWLLIEHPGPWPERVEQLEEPAPAAEAIRRAQEAGVRAQLIRRPGRRRATPPLRVYVGRSIQNAGAGEVWLAGRDIADPAELAEIDMAALAAGGRCGFGEPRREPLLLACTHGRRNTCCARSGVPLARELAGRYGEAVWETTHVGGDRFAANLVCLPHGVYYGDLAPAEALRAADAYFRGEVVLDRLRGRAGQPEPAQAAEHFVREHTGLMAVEAVSVESLSGTSDDSGGAGFAAVVRAAGARYQVTVMRATETADSCEPGCEEDLRSYILGDLALLNDAALV